MLAPDSDSILALDVGDKRVGVAIASLVARLPRPLTTLERGDDFFNRLREIIEAEQIGAIIVGLPRGLDGQQTSQTHVTEEFIRQLKQAFQVPLFTQDEALTSQKAEEELEARNQSYSRGDIDALAATYILEDFLAGYNREQESNA